jgi:hypothetical protein
MRSEPSSNGLFPWKRDEDDDDGGEYYNAKINKIRPAKKCNPVHTDLLTLVMSSKYCNLPFQKSDFKYVYMLRFMTFSGDLSIWLLDFTSLGMVKPLKA